ncbi:MAG: hypothetical protein ABFS86_21190 [Planctomycetota bacterium]
MLLVLGIPRPDRPRPPAVWDVLAVIVPDLETELPTLRGRRPFATSMDDSDKKRVRAELAAFASRVRERTGGRLAIRARVVTATRPLTTLSGPGPYWISPADVAPILDAPVAGADSVIAFVKIGGDRGRAVPTRHFGAAFGGDAGMEGACFAAVTFRPRWLDGTGDVVIHEWLHHLDWALTEVGGFPDDAFPDPDDGAGIDDILENRLTEAMIRSADARRGPAVADGWLRGWRVDGEAVTGSWRTLTLSRDARSAAAAVPAGTARLRVVADGPVLVGPERVRVDRDAVLRIPGDRVEIRHAQPGRDSRIRIRALPAAAR